MPRVPRERIEEAVRLRKEGKNLKEIMLGIGYPESMANRGLASMPKEIKAAFAKLEFEKSKELIELGKQVTPEMVQNAVKGRLMQNLMDGEDSAVQSAKALGSWREVDMFKSDIVGAGVIVLAAPNVVATPKVIEGEVIEVKELPALPEGDN